MSIRRTARQQLRADARQLSIEIGKALALIQCDQCQSRDEVIRDALEEADKIQRRMRAVIWSQKKLV